MTSASEDARRPAGPTLLFVFGMGRSGSSALSRVLALCGGTLPAALVGATEGNRLGHWEPQDALDVNEAILSRYDSTWFDPTLRLQGEISFSPEQRAGHLEQIETFLRSLPAVPLVVIKEPRITALSEFWCEAAGRIGSSVAFVIPVRHPEEVAASLAARDEAPPELSLALWLKYNLLAERHSRGFRRVFVEYANLLRDWRTEISRIAATLAIDLGHRDESAIDEFLRQDLRRQRHSGAVTDAFGAQWVSKVHDALCAAARDEMVDMAVMDEVFESYRKCERAFRISLDGFRARFSSAEVARKPHITQLILAVAGGGSQMLRSYLETPWYRERNPDVVASGHDPYEHWLAQGALEGRLPCHDPLALLDALMQARLSRPAAGAPASR